MISHGFVRRLPAGMDGGGSLREGGKGEEKRESTSLFVRTRQVPLESVC